MAVKSVLKNPLLTTINSFVLKLYKILTIAVLKTLLAEFYRT